MDFEPTPEQQELKRAVRAFAREALDGDLSAAERTGCFPRAKWEAAAAFGLQGLPLPEAYGGSGRDLLTTVLAMEGLGEGCPDNGFILSLNAHVWAVEMPIFHFGTEAQKQRYLSKLVRGEWIGVDGMTEAGSGSDAFNIRTRADRDGDSYVLNGSKTFITNAPIADLVLAYATVDPSAGSEGLSAFVVERGTPGLSLGKGIETMGMRTSPMGEIFLEDCRVPASQRIGEEGAGVAMFNSSMEYERACILAAGLGTLERQLARCVERARTWERFGKPIGKFQSVANRIADMSVRLETARLLTYKVAWLKSRKRRASRESAMAKLYVSECMVQSSLDAIQIFGASGYATEVGIERDLRDAVGGTIYSGPSDIQRMIIARFAGV